MKTFVEYISEYTTKCTNEKTNTDDMDYLYSLIGSDSKTDQLMWDWFEKNLDDSGIYPGDAVPEDYLEIMDKKQVKALAKYMRGKI